jgi:FkbM family methyltransferase
MPACVTAFRRPGGYGLPLSPGTAAQQGRSRAGSAQWPHGRDVSDPREHRTRAPLWLHRVLGHRRVLPLTALLLRARTVQPSARFLARELLRRQGLVAYRLRGRPVRVLVRHTTGDPVTLGEVFHERDYAPPPGAVRAAPSRIVDLGANVGYFGAFALTEWPEASVVAYEPDPANAALHAHTIRINGLEERWRLHRAAASNRNGELRFHASGDALSHAGESGSLVVPAEDVLPAIAGVDLLKMDIEGGEWPILGDPRFVTDPPRAIVLEYHPDGAPGPDPHQAVVDRLAAAGLTATATVFRRSDGYGMLWAWRP